MACWKSPMIFIFPVGHDDSKFHRFPLCSAAIVVTCLIVFANTWPVAKKEAGEVENLFRSIVARSEAIATGRGTESSAVRALVEEAQNAPNYKVFLDKIDGAIEKREAFSSEAEWLGRLKEDIRNLREGIANGVFNRYGLVSDEPRLHAFLTHMFLHGGFGHILFNMLFFLLVGPSLEDRWGRIVFPIAYLLSGLGAALGYMAVSGSSPVPMVGASGAIAGLMGAFLITFTYSRVQMLALIVVKVVPFSMPAWVFLPLWIGGEILSGLSQLQNGSAGAGGVAHWAHITGFFFGLGVPFFLRWSGIERKLLPLYTRVGDKTEIRYADASLEFQNDRIYRRAVRLRDECDWTGAVEAFQAAIRRHPDAIEPHLEMAEAYRLAGEPQMRRDALLPALELAAQRKHPRLIEVYETLRKAAGVVKASADCYFRLATAYESSGQIGEALARFQKVVDQFPEHPLSPKAAAKATELRKNKVYNPPPRIERTKG